MRTVKEIKKRLALVYSDILTLSPYSPQRIAAAREWVVLRWVLAGSPKKRARRG